MTIPASELKIGMKILSRYNEELWVTGLNIGNGCVVLEHDQFYVWCREDDTLIDIEQ